MRRGASVGSGGRGNLREEPRRPRPYSRHCGALPSTIIYARRHQWERRRRITTRHAASLQRPRGLHRRGLRAWRWAGESSRGTAKTPPLQSALRSALRPNAAHCHRLHAYTMPRRETCVFLSRRGAPRRCKNHRVSGGRHVGWAWYAHTVAMGRACAYGGRAFVATWRAASRLKITASRFRRRGVLKPRVHGGMRGGMVRAWWRPWATFGSQCEAQ